MIRNMVGCFHLALVFHTASASFGNPNKFLIVSAPRDGTVSYTRIRPSPSLKSGNSVTTLISTGLVHPQGLAVDQTRERLLVADPDSQMIFAYPLVVKDDQLGVGSQMVVASNVEARWVAVDGIGNIFFSDEPKNKIMKIPAGEVTKGNTTALTAFNGASMMQVSAPGGVAVDSFNAFWVNKQTGTQTGSVVRGAEQHVGDLGSAEDQVSVLELSKNTDKSYGVCLALSNVYYTQPERTIFGVKKSGGAPVTISDRLVNPRGCAWDGDGTVYVADRGANAVFSFPGNMQHLSMAQVTKSVEVADAFGVAVFSGAPTSRAVAVLLAVGLSLARWS